MNRYLAILFDTSGRWTSSSLTQAYVLEADDDKAAAEFMASYSKERSYSISFFGRITEGLQIQKVKVPAEAGKSDITDFSHQHSQKIGFTQLSIGESMISLLQPFDPKERKKRLDAIKRREKKDKADRARVAAMPIPKVGDNIYVPTALYLSRGRDDVMGGLAKVKSVSKQMSGGTQVHFVSVNEIPGSFNWEQHLALMQVKLKKEFGKKRAYPDPDNHPGSNEP